MNIKQRRTSKSAVHEKKVKTNIKRELLDFVPAKAKCSLGRAAKMEKKIRVRGRNEGKLKQMRMPRLQGNKNV